MTVTTIANTIFTNSYNVLIGKQFNANITGLIIQMFMVICAWANNMVVDKVIPNAI